MICDDVAGCFDDVEMTALLDGRVDDTVRDGMLTHVAKCARCAEAFQRLSAGWSLEHLAAPQRQPAGADTLALRERLAASPPPSTGGEAAATAAIPRAVPAIPGIVELEAIGRGGMGVVYRGRDTRLDRLVAVKVLSAWAPLSHSARERAEREALMLGRLHHPNVVAIHAAGEIDGTPYLVMEWVAGPSLQKRLASERLQPREAARIARDLARAIERVHALGIIHRDIKPDNVLMTPQADAPATPKLADFGLARPEAVTQQLTQSEDVLGTPAYMAPEQTGLDPALGEVGPSADIHGLGGVLFAMLTGHAPYEAATSIESMQRSLRGEVTGAARAAHAPVDLRTIMWKCLEPMPGQRYRSAGELADDLERFLDGRPVSARPLPLPWRLAKWARRRPVAAAAAGLTAALVAVAIGGTAYHVVQLERANTAITRSRDEAQTALSVAQRSMQRLTSESIQRMLMRGSALDAGDRDYLRQIRDEFLKWPLGSDPAEALRFRQEGIKRVGELFEKTNQVEDSLACALAREELIEELARHPSSADTHDEIDDLRIDTLLDQVANHRALNDLAASIDAGRRLIRIIESSSPERRAARALLLAGSKCDVGGSLTRLGRDEEGAPLVAAGLEEVRRLREASPDDGAFVMEELRVLFNAAQSSWRMQRHDERITRLEHMVALCAESIDRFPDNRLRIAEKYSVALANLANIATENERWEEALPLVERRLTVCRQAMDAAPGVAEARIQLVDAMLQIFKVHRGLKRLQDSRPLLAEALPIADRLVSDQPASFAAAHLLARVLHSVAELEKAVGAWEASMAALDRQFALLEPWRSHATQKQNVERQLGLARVMADWVQKKLDAVADDTARTAK